MPTGTAAFDILISGEARVPTGCMLIGVNADTNDTTQVNFIWSVGFTDFTNTAVVGANSKQGAVNPSDTHSFHDESATILQLTTSGTGTVYRSATIAAKAGGITVTPGQSGDATFISVVLVFGTAAIFVAGEGVL